MDKVDEAFAQWEHGHRREQYSIELRAFRAGWEAAKRENAPQKDNEQLKSDHGEAN